MSSARVTQRDDGIGRMHTLRHGVVAVILLAMATLPVARPATASSNNAVRDWNRFAAPGH